VPLMVIETRCRMGTSSLQAELPPSYRPV